MPFQLSFVFLYCSFSLSHYLWLLDEKRSLIKRKKLLGLQETVRQMTLLLLGLQGSYIRTESLLVWRCSSLCAASLYHIQLQSLQHPTRTFSILLNTHEKQRVSLVLGKVEYMDSCALSHVPSHPSYNKKEEKTSTSNLVAEFQRSGRYMGKGGFCLLMTSGYVRKQFSIVCLLGHGEICL